MQPQALGALGHSTSLEVGLWWFWISFKKVYSYSHNMSELESQTRCFKGDPTSRFANHYQCGLASRKKLTNGGCLSGFSKKIHHFQRDSSAGREKHIVHSSLEMMPPPIDFHVLRMAKPPSRDIFWCFCMFAACFWVGLCFSILFFGDDHVYVYIYISVSIYT